MTLLSTCCETTSIGETAEGIGICGRCNDTVSFEEGEEIELDTELENEYSWQQYINQRPTTAPFTAKPVSDAQRMVDVGIACGIAPEVYNKFQPSTISWITDRIAVTSRDGVDQALSEGHFVINTADEINNNAQVKIAVDAGSGNVLSQLNSIYKVMDTVLTGSTQNVVVHCAMGMERSVLSVVWYLANKNNMTLKRSLGLVQSKRAIAQDRLSWILT